MSGNSDYWVMFVICIACLMMCSKPGIVLSGPFYSNCIGLNLIAHCWHSIRPLISFASNFPVQNEKKLYCLDHPCLFFWYKEGDRHDICLLYCVDNEVPFQGVIFFLLWDV